jgi:outer membrane immunogenic protein
MLGWFRKFAMSAFLVAPLATGAASADSAPAPNWGGLYLGSSYGLAGTHFKGSYVTTAATNRHDVEGTSQIRGGFAGLQHQWGQILLGVEANYSGTGWSDDWDARRDSASSQCLQGIAGLQCRARLDSIFTVGPRIGYVPSSKWLLFATGGYASGRIDTSVLTVATKAEIGTSANRHNGWFAGAGIEYSYSPNWSIGLEYQHIALDTERHFDSKFTGCCTVTPETRDIKADADVIRMRTTFKFNRPAPSAEPMK